MSLLSITKDGVTHDSYDAEHERLKGNYGAMLYHSAMLMSLKYANNSSIVSGAVNGMLPLHAAWSSQPPQVSRRTDAHRISGAADGDANVGPLERGRVVDAIAGHAHAVARLPQRLHDEVLVLRPHLRMPTW